MALKWKNSYSCNIIEIDAQHKRLFQIGAKLNILEPVCSHINFEEEIREVITELRLYTQLHFSYEEKLLEKYEFPGLAQHIHEHEDFVKAVTELESPHTDFRQPDLVSHIITFVNSWIVRHILQSDKQYMGFLHEKGIH